MIIRGPGGAGGQLTGKARARCGPWESFRSWDHNLLRAEMAQRRGLVEVVGGCWEGGFQEGYQGVSCGDRGAVTTAGPCGQCKGK